MLPENKIFDFSDAIMVPDGTHVHAPSSRYDLTTLKYGQMKLLLTEIQFLTLYWDPDKHPNPIVIVPGGAPGNHFIPLAEMFPEIEFRLYDPAKFDDEVIRYGKNIKTIDGYFTLDTAKSFEKDVDSRGVFFISDVRDRYIQKHVDYNELEEYNKTIMEDLKMQRDWLMELKPTYALLKFNLPAPLSHDVYYTYYNYLYGTVYKQAFAPQHTNETRLVPHKDADGNYTEIVWDTRVYGDQMRYFNLVVREMQKFNNPFTDKLEPVYAPQLMNDYDTSYMVFILRNYLRSFGGSDGVQDTIGLFKFIMMEISIGRSDNMIHTPQRLRRDPGRSKYKTSKGAAYGQKPPDKKSLESMTPVTKKSVLRPSRRR